MKLLTIPDVLLIGISAIAVTWIYNRAVIGLGQPSLAA